MDSKKRVKILEKEQKAQEKFNKKYYREEDLGKEKEKRSFFVFWELIIENLWKFFMLNLVYGIIFTFIAGLGWWINLIFIPNGEYSQFISNIPYMFVIVVFLGILLGPVTAACTYIFQKLITGKRFCFFSDFLRQFASNFKQSFIFGVFDAIIVASVLALWWLFGAIMSIGADLKTAIIVCLIAFLLFLYYSMRPYIYLQIVTVNLKISQILRNALFFAVLGVKSNILSFLIFVLLTGIGVLGLVWTPWLLLFWLICGFSLTGFVQIFCVYKVFHQHLIAPEEARAEKEAELDSLTDVQFDKNVKNKETENKNEQD